VHQHDRSEDEASAEGNKGTKFFDTNDQPGSLLAGSVYRAGEGLERFRKGPDEKGILLITGGLDGMDFLMCRRFSLDFHRKIP
jgi:hypothetical protein